MHITMTSPEADTLTRAEAARRLGIKPATLARWAQQGRGPGYSLTGERKGRAIYTLASIAAWVEQRRVDRTKQPARTPDHADHPDGGSPVGRSTTQTRVYSS